MTSMSEAAPLRSAPTVGRGSGGGNAGALPPSAPRRSRLERLRKPLEITILVGPALLVFLAFVIFPVGIAAYYGFFSWTGFGPADHFIGLRNYTQILADEAFRSAVWHNAEIVGLSLITQGPIALLIALMLNRKMRFQSALRVLIFVPYVISEVVVGTGLSLMLASGGAVNDLLGKLGLGSLKEDWLSNPHVAIWTLVTILIWKYIGFAVLLFLAGLQGIPEELTEAAQIDGASYWQVQRRIVLPLLAPTVRIWAFLSIIGSLQLFDVVYIIWGQYVAATAGTSTMATYMVTTGRTAGQYGYGSAVAVVMFLISLAVALVYQRFVLRRDTEGAVTGGAA